MGKRRFLEKGIGEIAQCEVGGIQDGTYQHRVHELGTKGIDSIHLATAEIGVTKVRAGEIRTLELGAGQIYFLKQRPLEIGQTQRGFA